jgi:hypothetical protein
MLATQSLQRLHGVGRRVPMRSTVSRPPVQEVKSPAEPSSNLQKVSASGASSLLHLPVGTWEVAATPCTGRPKATPSRVHQSSRPVSVVPSLVAVTTQVSTKDMGQAPRPRHMRPARLPMLLDKLLLMLRATLPHTELGYA